jgi:hypothetical protein
LAFFDADNNKYDFAKKFIEELKSEVEYQEMDWIGEIREFFENNAS